MLNSTEKNRVKISISDVYEISKKYTHGIIYNFCGNPCNRCECENANFGRNIPKITMGNFTFDNFVPLTNTLDFEQVNGIDKLRLNRAYISEIYQYECVTFSVPLIEIKLIDGERWFVRFFSEIDQENKPDEGNAEIGINDVIKMLKNCTNVSVSYERTQVSFTNNYDIISVEAATVEETIDDDSLNEVITRGIEICLGDSKNESANCTMHIFDTGLHPLVNDERLLKLRVGLIGNPFTDVVLTIFHPQETEDIA